jgi:hypothetical protein
MKKEKYDLMKAGACIKQQRITSFFGLGGGGDDDDRGVVNNDRTPRNITSDSDTECSAVGSTLRVEQSTPRTVSKIKSTDNMRDSKAMTATVTTTAKKKKKLTKFKKITKTTAPASSKLEQSTTDRTRSILRLEDSDSDSD